MILKTCSIQGPCCTDGLPANCFICDSRDSNTYLWVGRCNRICIQVYLPTFVFFLVCWTEHKSFCSSQLLLSGPEEDRNSRMQVCLHNSTPRDYMNLFFTWRKNLSKHGYLKSDLLKTGGTCNMFLMVNLSFK